MEEIALMALPREVEEESDAHSTSREAELCPNSPATRSNDGKSDPQSTSTEGELPPSPVLVAPDVKVTGSKPVSSNSLLTSLDVWWPIEARAALDEERAAPDEERAALAAGRAAGRASHFEPCDESCRPAHLWVRNNHPKEDKTKTGSQIHSADTYMATHPIGSRCSCLLIFLVVLNRILHRVVVFVRNPVKVM